MVLSPEAPKPQHGITHEREGWAECRATRHRSVVQHLRGYDRLSSALDLASHDPPNGGGEEGEKWKNEGNTYEDAQSVLLGRIAEEAHEHHQFRMSRRRGGGATFVVFVS